MRLCACGCTACSVSPAQSALWLRTEGAWAALTGAAVLAGEGFGTWQLTCLTDLSLQNGSSLSDQGLAALTQLDSLRCLNLKGCRALSDAGLAALPALSRLSRLRLQVRLPPLCTRVIMACCHCEAR